MSLKKPLPHAAWHARELRKRLTKAEKLLWEILRNRKFHGYKFRRQAPIGRFIADFLCTNPPLIIEVDGSIHDTRKKQDAERTEGILNDHTIPILRLTNDEVLQKLDDALNKIKLALKVSHLKQDHPPLSRTGGRGAGGEVTCE